MSTEYQNALLEEARATVKRRELFHRVFTPEVLDELDKYLGTDSMIYAFKEEDTDPLLAMRRDTLMGIMRSLRHESAEEQLALARTNLARIEEEVQHG